MDKRKKKQKEVLDFDSFKDTYAPKEQPVRQPRRTYQHHERPPPSEGPIDLQRGAKQQENTRENRSPADQEFQRGMKQSPSSSDGPRNFELQRGVKHPTPWGSEQSKNLNFERGVKQQDLEPSTRQSDLPFERGVKNQTNIDIDEQNQGQYQSDLTPEFRRGVEQPPYENDRNHPRKNDRTDNDKPFERGSKIQGHRNQNHEEGRNHKDDRINENFELIRGGKQNREDHRGGHPDTRELVRGRKQEGSNIHQNISSNNKSVSTRYEDKARNSANSPNDIDNDQNEVNNDEAGWKVVSNKKKKDSKKNLNKSTKGRDKKYESSNENIRNKNKVNMYQDVNDISLNDHRNDKYIKENEQIIDDSTQPIDQNTDDGNTVSHNSEQSNLNVQDTIDSNIINKDGVLDNSNESDKVESLPKIEIPEKSGTFQVSTIQPENVEQAQSLTLAQRLSEKIEPKTVPSTQKVPETVTNDLPQNTRSPPSIEELKRQAEEKTRRNQFSGTSYFYPHITLPMPTIIETCDDSKKSSLRGDITDLISDATPTFVKVVMTDLKLSSSTIVEFLCLLINHMFTSLSEENIVRNIIKELIVQKYINSIHLMCSFQLFYTNMEDLLIDYPKANIILSDLLKFLDTVQILDFKPSSSDNKDVSDLVNYFLNLSDSEPSEYSEELILFSFVVSLFISQNNNLCTPVHGHEQCFYIPYLIEHKDYLLKCIGNLSVEKQVNILQKAVELILQLGFPDNILESFFYTLYDCDVIREPAFISWYERYSEREEYSKANKQTSDLFVWLQNADYQ